MFVYQFVFSLDGISGMCLNIMDRPCNLVMLLLHKDLIFYFCKMVSSNKAPKPTTLTLPMPKTEVLTP